MSPTELRKFISSSAFSDLHDLVEALAASTKKSRQKQSRERAMLALMLGQTSFQYKLRDDEWGPIIDRLPLYADLRDGKIRSQLINVGRMLIAFRDLATDADQKLGWTQLRTISEMSNDVQEKLFEEFLSDPNALADLTKVDLEEHGRAISVEHGFPFRRKEHLKPDKYSQKQLKANVAIGLADNCFNAVSKAIQPFKNRNIDELADDVWDEFALRMISTEYQWRACSSWFAAQVKRREGYRDKR